MFLFNRIFIIGWALIFCYCNKVPPQVEQQVHSNNEKTAISFLAHLQNKKYLEAVNYFDNILLEAMPAEKLKQIWEQIRSQIGEFEEKEGISTKKENEIDTVYIKCKFEKTKVDIKLAFAKNGKIIGIFFLPPK